MPNWATLGVPPPADRHDRVQSRRFLRNFLARSWVVSALMFGVVLLVTDVRGWIYMLLGVALITHALEVVWLTYRVRRDQRNVSRP